MWLFVLCQVQQIRRLLICIDSCGPD